MVLNENITPLQISLQGLLTNYGRRDNILLPIDAEKEHRLRDYFETLNTLKKNKIYRRTCGCRHFLDALIPKQCIT